jgi:hypothetical protein
MGAYTPLEQDIIRRLATDLAGAGIPARRLRIFGSRARGRSDEHSDLDIAVDLGSPRDPGLARRVRDLGFSLSVRPEGGGPGLRVQLLPLFEGEELTPLARTIAREAETVWTRT